MAAHLVLKPCRLLRRLDDRIVQASSDDPVGADCLRAERAVYLARQGAATQADAVMVDLRQRYDATPRFAISAWVNLCEGIASHFSDMGALASVKVHRAHALSQAAGLKQLCALTAAWSAHLDYLDASFESMAAHLAQALCLAEADNHGARSRASLVVGQALHVAGRFDLARPWYEATRQHAVDDGDDATLGALLHNSAWLRAAQLRQDILLHGASITADSEHTLMSAESTQHFDRLVGARSLQSLTPILRAQIVAVLGRPAEAIALYDRHFEAARAQGISRTIEADLLADRAWCHFAVGDSKTARRHAATALERLDPGSHCIDRLLAHKRLAQVFTGLGDDERAAAHEALSAQALEGHRREQERILTALSALLAANAPGLSGCEQRPGSRKTLD